MEELYKEGKIRAIGLSNFYPDRLSIWWSSAKWCRL
ncbi:aldo/keto reductase [Paenibacillus sp. p3-SID867]